VVYRALGRTAATLDEPLPWEAVAHHLRELFTADWQPTLVSGDEAPLAYAPYKLTHMSGAQPQPTISAALEAFYAAREGLTAHQQRRDAVRQPLEAARQRLQHQRDQIMAELEHTENLEMLRWEGEMIFAFLHTITPGQTALEVEGHTITLDPEKGPVECAQARFRRYHKARSGHESLQERLRITDGQLAGIEQLLALLEVADEREQIDQIAFEAEEQQYITPARKKQDARAGKTSTRRRPPRRKPLHLVSSDGFDMYVGRSATQNDEVTFRIGRPDDLWLHVRGIPGAHVIVRSGRQDVPEQTLREAGGVAAYFSGARAEPAVDIEISHRRHVRKIPGGTPGLVTYRAERTLRVAPLPPWG
jgi:predicted ribosome quality control (RQC) complex YloA/Tae2 family protein